MQSHLVLTVVGPDQPGLVNALSDTIAAAGGNWLDARMSSLAGQFAGVLLVAVDGARADALAASLKRLEARGLRLMIEKGSGEAHPAPAGAGRLRLRLLGQDRPGIVRDVSRVLAERRVSIVDFESEHASGSFSGENMFRASALIDLPAGLDAPSLRDALESLANELMVDLDLESGPDQGARA